MGKWSSIVFATVLFLNAVCTAEGVSVVGEAQLFVDDALLAHKTGVARHAHACSKLPEPVLVAEKPWEQDGDDKRVYVYGTVLRDEDTGRFRMWYNRLKLVLFAESEDGIHWNRPELGLNEWQGSTGNNIVLSDLHSPSVVYTPGTANPEFRYTMIGANKGYRLFHSPDGLRWSPCGDSPVFTGGDTCTLAYDTATGEYLAFHKRSLEYRGYPRRLVYLATSRDLRAWQEPKLVMGPDEMDDTAVVREGGKYSQFYNMSAFRHGGQYLGMATHFRYTGSTPPAKDRRSIHDGPIDVQLVHSRDGRTWSRCEDRSPVIPNGPYGYDAGCILGVANGPVTVGDEEWLYYTAITTTHGGAIPEKQISIALAKWRRDGFVSLDAGEEEGVVETVPLALPGFRLTVNADVAGTLSLAVLGESGQPLAGFSHEDCATVSGDSVRHVVAWKGHDCLPTSSAASLQFRMKRTRLFSFTIEAEPLKATADAKSDLLTYSDAHGTLQPATTPADCGIRRNHVLQNMQAVMGLMPAPAAAVPLDVRVEDVAEQPRYTRERITFAVEPWDRLPAYVFLPKDVKGKVPAVICLHPTSEFGKDVAAGLHGLPNRNYAAELAERGYVTIAPDYPGFGEYVEARKTLYAQGYTSCTMKGIWNHRRCIDLLQSLPEVDPARIGCIGHSLGGHNALFLAAFDDRIKVAVSSCGFTSFPKYKGGDLTGWTHDGYMPSIATVYGKDPARVPFDFPEVLAAIAPRAVFVNAPLRDDNFDASGVDDCVNATKRVFALCGQDNRLRVIHPDCEHDFPPEARDQAYAFLDAVLKQAEL